MIRVRVTERPDVLVMTFKKPKGDFTLTSAVALPFAYETWLTEDDLKSMKSYRIEYEVLFEDRRRKERRGS